MTGIKLPVIPDIKCDASGEVSVQAILDMINKLIALLKEFEKCCDEVKEALKIKTLREGNTLYITDDGSDPKK